MTCKRQFLYSIYIFDKSAPLCKFQCEGDTGIVSVCFLLNISVSLYDIFTKVGTNIKHQKTIAENKYLTYIYSFYRIIPLGKFRCENHVRQVTLKPFEQFSRNLVKYIASLDEVQKQVPWLQLQSQQNYVTSKIIVSAQ